MTPSMESLITRAHEAVKNSLVMPESTGIFYVVRMPANWELLSFRYDEFPKDIGHPDVWEQHVVPFLSAHWARELQTDPDLLAQSISLHCYGFPRGRVSIEGKNYRISFGDDITKAMGVNRAQVERCFGIEGKCVWKRDEHSLCLKPDVFGLQTSLALDEDWPYFNK